MEYEDFDLLVGGDFNVDISSGDERCGVLGAWARDLGVTCPALAPDAPRTPATLPMVRSRHCWTTYS